MTSLNEFDLYIKGSRVVLPFSFSEVDVAIKNGQIVWIGSGAEGVANQKKSKEIFNANGLVLFPGFIDPQVHFREPGLTHKEDLESGTRGALLGGVTSVFEMPNTEPPTTTREALADKVSRTQGRVHCHIGFYLGASPENLSHLSEWENESHCVGVKAFLGSSTGRLLVDDDEQIRAMIQSGRRRITIHSEDNKRLQERKKQIPVGATSAYHPIWRDEEVCLISTKKVLEFANQYSRRCHILHVSTAEEATLLVSYRRYLPDGLPLVSFETLPQYLYFDWPQAFEKWGSKVQMNPPVRGGRHRQALRSFVRQGLVDMIGSDHAPHTSDEKSKPYPECPSGMPGVQTIVPVMLHLMQTEGLCDPVRLSWMMSRNPAQYFGLERKGQIAVGYDADLTLVDLQKRWVLNEKEIASKCGWSPYVGETLVGKPTHVLLGGQWALKECEIVGQPKGQALTFF